ncbi:MAG: MarR family transcriptional regulator [Rickettsiales bacterium]
MEIDEYLSAIRMIERLHRQFLEMVRKILDAEGVRDLNAAQAVVLYHIGEDDVTVGELTNRGYYLGSNPSYNVRKMVEAGYLIQERSRHDKRSTRLRLSEKGLDVRGKLQDMFNRQTMALGPDSVSEDDLRTANEILARLEWFWGGSQGFGGGPQGFGGGGIF